MLGPRLRQPANPGVQRVTLLELAHAQRTLEHSRTPASGSCCSHLCTSCCSSPLSPCPLRPSLANLVRAAAVWMKLKLLPRSQTICSNSSIAAESLICLVNCRSNSLAACCGPPSASLLCDCLAPLASATELKLLLLLNQKLVLGWGWQVADAACAACGRPPAPLQLLLTLAGPRTKRWRPPEWARRDVLGEGESFGEPLARAKE